VSSTDVKKIIPIWEDKIIDTEVQRPNKLLGYFTGMQTSVTITDKDTKAAVNVQTYKPSIFSHILGNAKPTTIIQPLVDKEGNASKNSLKLASELAASFTATVATIEATYDYEKGDLSKGYANAQDAVKKEALTQIKDVAKNKVRNVTQEEATPLLQGHRHRVTQERANSKPGRDLCN